MNVVSGMIGGLLIGILAAFVVSIAVVPLLIGQGSGAAVAGIAPVTILVGIVVGTFIGIKASTAGKAWRRVLIISAILCFLLQIAGIVSTGGTASAVSGNSSNGVAAGTGAAIGAPLISGLLVFFGPFLGVIFLVIGLLVGRDKQVVYVQGPPPSK